MESLDDVAAPLRRCFTHEIEILPPDEAGRERVLRSAAGAAAANLPPLALSDAAAQTAGKPKNYQTLYLGYEDLGILENLGFGFRVFLGWR